MAQSDGWKNLVPANSANAVERGRLGGIRSGEVKRERKTMRAVLKALLDMPSSVNPDMSTMESICIALKERAEQGNLKAIEMIRDTVGEKPTPKDNDKVSGNIIVQWASDSKERVLQGEMPERDSLPCS